MREIISQVDILNELRKNLVPHGLWPTDDETRAGSAELRQLVASDYTSGKGFLPCSSSEEGLQWIATMLYHEFINRLDEPSPALTNEAVRQVASLASMNLIGKSKIEIRAAIERLLRRIGFPTVSKVLADHNDHVDAMCLQCVESLQLLSSSQSFGSWLLLLAAANPVEVWPQMSLECKLGEVLWHAAAAKDDADTFMLLAKRMEAKLRSGVPIGLFTDNHGEITVDLAFLIWLERYFKSQFFLFPKACSVELDIDTSSIASMRHHSFAKLQATIVPGGSRVPGNLLTLMSHEFGLSLLRIQAEGGIIIVKGLGNLGTVPGICGRALFVRYQERETST